jgi:cell division septation protein DedD
MAFNPDEPEQEAQQEESSRGRPQPILHRPRSTSSIPKALPVILLILVVIGGYWYYRSKRPAPPPVIVTAPPVDTAKHQVEPPPTVNQEPIVTKKNPQPRVENTPPAKKLPEKSEMTDLKEGKYTIYIASYAQEAPAQDEVSRWKEAGYPAYVSTKGKWYRVSLGKYASKKDARQEAEKLKDAFEDGYWIDVM